MTTHPKPSLLVPCFAGAAQGMVFIHHAPLIPLIIRDLGITPAEAGLLSTAVFLGGGLVAVPAGRLTDRLGARRVMGLSLVLFTLGTVGLALAPSYPALLAIRLFTGTAVTATFIAGGHYMNAVWGGRHVYLAQGYYGGALQFGIGASIFVLPWLARVFGWRTALGLPAIPVALAWLVWQLAAVDARGTPHRPGATRRVLRDPAVWRLALANAASFGLNVVLGTWIAAYFVHEFGMALTSAGALGSLSVLLGIVARPLGGVLVTRGWSQPGRLILGMLTGSASAVLALAWPGRPLGVAALAVVVVGLAASLGYAANLVLVARAQPDAAGAALGVIGVVSTASIVVGAPTVGALLSVSGHFTVPFAALVVLPVGAIWACRALGPPVKGGSPSR